jgi:hypothetical protein
MPRTTYDPNPHVGILDDGALKRQITANVERMLDLNSRLLGSTISTPAGAPRDQEVIVQRS